MKYLKCFESTNPSDSMLRDWIMFEFEDNPDFDLDEIVVTKIIVTKHWLEFKVVIDQDFHKKLESMYHDYYVVRNDGSLDIKKVAVEINEKVINKLIKKYNISMKHYIRAGRNFETYFVSDYIARTEMLIYFNQELKN